MDSARVKRDVITTFAIFALNGMVIGSWTSRIPAVKEHLAVDYGTMGLVFLSMGLGSLISMPFTGLLLKRVPISVVNAFVAIVAGSAFIVLTQVTQVWTFIAIYALTGFCWGVWDVTVNVLGAAVEREYGKTIMPALHGAWGGGMFLGAMIGALFAGSGIGLAGHLGVILPMVVVAAVVIGFTWQDYRERTAEHHADSEHVPLGKLVVPALLIGTMMLCSTIGEGSASDWLALHMVEDRGTSDAVGASVYVVYALTLTVSRLIGALLIAKLGRVNAVRVSGVVTAVGVLLVIVAPGLWASYLGAAMWGFGLAVVFPMGISVAGERGGVHSSHLISWVSTMAYGGFLIGPAALGFVANHWGLERALIIPAVLGLCFAALAVVARTPAQRPVAEPIRG